MSTVSPCASPTKFFNYDFALEAIFEKTLSAMEKEFIDIAMKKIPDNQKPVGAPHTDVDAHHCLDNTVILSQEPHPSILNSFLGMLYTHADTVIAILQYEPVYFINDGTLETDQFTVVRKNRKTSSQGIHESTLEITPKGSEPRSIPHFHCDSWEDVTGCDPKIAAALVRIAMNAKKPVIHCHAGEGRTGVVALTISAYQKILAGDNSYDVIEKSLIELRGERPGCVHVGDQYVTAYRAVEILLQEDKLIPPPRFYSF